MLEAGVKAIHALQPAFSISARCTVQRLNCGHLEAAVESARDLGLNGISFLAADVTSEAFNRPGGWTQTRQTSVSLSHEDVEVLDQQIENLLRFNSDGYVAESAVKLRRIPQHFRAYLEEIEPVAPLCNAPWVSAVVESDGTVRPCFFHPAIGTASESAPLLSVINGKRGVEFRRSLDVSTNPVCRRCVCSLNWNTTSRR
jgi:MoaA/NifB/PqqE/SkfB family radical SAM enzyme